MLFNPVNADANHLRAALFPLIGKPRHGAEFGRANGGEILRMREQDRPAVTDELMQRKTALIGFDGKVGNSVVDTQAHDILRVNL